MRLVKKQAVIVGMIVSLSAMSLAGCGCDDEVKKEKPVVYFYPEENHTSIEASIAYNGTFTTVYPAFTQKDGWKFTADKDGTIKLGDTEYGYLFWEGEDHKSATFETGYCVAKEELIPFLEKELTEQGLNDKEKDDFITYWLPRLSQNDYNLITFDKTEYKKAVKLHIKPQPDNIIRVFMSYKGVEKPVKIKAPMKEKTPERSGFTVVEWGGCELK